MTEIDCGGIFHVDRSTSENKYPLGKELKNKKELPSSGSVLLSVSTTNAHELITALIKHFRPIFECHGAHEYVPSTLLLLRDSPAITLGADLLFDQSLFLSKSKNIKSSSFSKMKNNDRITLFDLWNRNIILSNLNSNLNSGLSSSSNRNRLAVAEYLEPGAGLIVSLPYDLISPFARTASLLNIQSSVRYQIGKVYFSRSTNIFENKHDYDSNQEIGNGNGGQNPLTPLGVGSGEHPLGANEVVFDIIHRGKIFSKVDVECEIISVALNCLSAVRNSLPALALRITDSRLLDALLEICIWPLPHSTSSVTTTTSSTTSSSTSTSSSYKPLEQINLYDIDIERLLRALSLCTDIDDGSGTGTDEIKLPKYLQLLTDLNLPLTITKRLIPFFRLFSMQYKLPLFVTDLEKTDSFLGYPLSVLDAFEKEFYNMDVIILLQRLLAKQNDNRRNNDDKKNENNEKYYQEETLQKKKSKINGPIISTIGVGKGKVIEKTNQKNTPALATIINNIGVKVTGRDKEKEKEKEREREKVKEKEEEKEKVKEKQRNRERYQNQESHNSNDADSDIKDTSEIVPDPGPGSDGNVTYSHTPEIFSKDDFIR